MGDKMRARDWMWVLHGESADDLEKLVLDRKRMWEQTEGMKYMVVGVETGEKSETPHLQGYTCWSEAKTKRKMYKWVTGLATKKFWIDKRRGTPEEASKYCKKEGNYVEFGTLPVGQGKRTDLDNVAEALEDGATMRNVIDERKLQAVQYAKIWLTYNEEERDMMQRAQVYWYWGVSGAGKTHMAREEIAKLGYEKKDIFKLKCPEPGTKTWWDGYDKHPCVLLDDFRAYSTTLRELIGLIEGPHRVEVKGGFRQMLARHIFITTNKSPADSYGDNWGEEMHQLERRIFYTRVFTQRWEGNMDLPPTQEE